MTILLKNFKVTNLNSGNRLQSGRKTQEEINTIFSQKNTISNVFEEQRVPGTPALISSGGLKDKAHMSIEYIRIIRQVGENNNDSIFIPDRMRITKLSGDCKANNTVAYAFSASNNTSPTELTWTVLYGNGNAQLNGDYFDLDLPDETSMPNLYLALILIKDGWRHKTVISEEDKIVSIPSNLPYYCVNPQYSTQDPNINHMIVSQGYNIDIGVKSRIVVAFEDWELPRSDFDYNDVIISISSVYLDENNINDTFIS